MAVLSAGRAATAFGGWADVARRQLVDERMLFRIGSTGKTFTALAALQLVDSGQVGLDDPPPARAV